MNTSINIWVGFALSAGGILIGWLLNQLSSWFRIRGENKKLLSKLLFIQLETYHLFSKTNVSNWITPVADQIMTLLPKEMQNEQDKKELIAFVNPLLDALIKSLYENEFIDLEKKYQVAVSELASCFPIIAFNLSGSTTITQITQYIEGWSAQIKDVVPEELNNMFATITKNHIDQNILNTLKEDIKIIAWRVSPIAAFKIKKYLNRSNKLNEAEINERLKPYLTIFQNVAATSFSEQSNIN